MLVRFPDYRERGGLQKGLGPMSCKELRGRRKGSCFADHYNPERKKRSLWPKESYAVGDPGMEGKRGQQACP